MKRRRLSLELQLIIPGLLDRVGTWSHEGNDLPRFHSVETLLTRSQRVDSHHTGYDEVVCALAGVTPERDGELPLGALTRCGLTGQFDEGFYLAADPVHLRADIQQLVLLDGGQLALKERESAALAALFSDHFKECGVRLEMNAPDRWHLRLAQPENIRTHPLRGVMGKNIEPYLVEGERAIFWRILLNEVQMLFHNSPINRARESEGEPTVNSLWIYGAGRLPRPLITDWAAIWADDPMARGIGHVANLYTQRLPQGLETLLNDPVAGVHVVCLESLGSPASYDDLSAWCRHMERLEISWFGPIVEAMQKGLIDACHIHDCAGQRFTVKKAHQWWFKKRPRPLHDFARSHKTKGLPGN